MKLAVVVQRYGANINGGAELHARYIAEHLAHHADVDVITTCALDYVTWRNELPRGREVVHGLTVHRFPVDRERNVKLFARRSTQVFEQPHSHDDELAWLDSEGPTSRALVKFLRSKREVYDFFLFFSYRYYHSFHGIHAVGSRALLVPTAERDEVIGLSVFGPVFRGVRALMYNSPEERAMITAATSNDDVPGVVVGIGSEVPPRPDPMRFRAKYGINGRFAIYVGRIDENKGCRELFEFFLRYARARRASVTLVLIGQAVLEVPEDPRIRHLGFLSDEDKFDAIAAADLLIMPSYFESLSMVALEAWALGRPVLANGRCEVLKGQCVRSNAGLFYETYEEFAEALRSIVDNALLAEALGMNGRVFYRQQYDWPVIERKYLAMLESLKAEDAAGMPAREVAPLPGWLARRRRVLPPARDILAQIPTGPVLS
ncbi:MAG TPA: glycosyltransferase family 4 protein [Vicinamibacterales bacterium]